MRLPGAACAADGGSEADLVVGCDDGADPDAHGLGEDVRCEVVADEDHGGGRVRRPHPLGDRRVLAMSRVGPSTTA